MKLEFPIKASELATFLQVGVLGDSEVTADHFTSIDRTDAGALTFAVDERSLAEVNRSVPLVVLTTAALAEICLSENPNGAYLVVADPKRAFAAVASQLKKTPNWSGVHASALLDPTVELAAEVGIGAYVVIGPRVRIGARTQILPYSFIGEGSVIGEDCIIYPRVTVLERVELRHRVKVFPGSVIGSDGFGFVSDPSGSLAEVPQLGTVVIEDDVRIGANCTIDRATLGATVVGARSKLDDQVHVGHNVRIGKDCLLCGGAMMAGSSVLEDRVVLGGQAGIGDHTRIGAGARLGGQSGSGFDLEGGKDYFLTPAMPVKDSLRLVALWKKLPDLFDRVRRLEKESKKGETSGG